MTREEAITWCDRFNDAWANADPEDDFPDLKYNDTLDQLFYLAGQALRQQDVTDTNVGHNDPMTLDEMRKVDGEPVFLVDLVHKSDPQVPDLWGGWIVFTKHDQNGFIPRGGGFFSNDGYGKTWLAYRQKPEEDSANG